MYRYMILLPLICVILLIPKGAHAMPSADLYISPAGNDAWSGALTAPNAMHTDGPFATIGRAQKAVRQLRASGNDRKITVLLRAGTYPLTSPVTFTPEDSNTTYAAFPGEKPVISGGQTITGWTKHADGVWTVELPDVKAGKWYFRDLYVNGQRRSRPRLPKQDYFHIESSLGNDVRNAFRYTEGDVWKWSNLDDVEVVAFNAWDELRFHVQSIDDKSRVITFTGSNNWPWGQWGQSNQRYYAENVREAFDQPGQWYLDRMTGVLAYRPMAGEDMRKAEVIAPRINELVRIQGGPAKDRFVEQLDLNGLSFRFAGWDIPKESYISIQAAVKVPGAIHAERTRDCTIQDCEISQVGEYGIDLAGDCRNTIVKGNAIHDMGAGGIKLGSGDYNLITHNHLYDLGHVFLSAVGVWLGNSGHNTISYNHIHDLNYTGISVGWSWGYGPTLTQENIIEHNHIHSIGRGLLSDMGGIYTLGLAQGSVIRYNLIHDVQSYSYGGWGIYLDEGTSGMLVENNIVYHTKTGGFHQHYGEGNIIRNNIFAFADQGQIQRTRQEAHVSFTFEHNIVFWNEGPLFSGNWNDPASYKLDNNIYWTVKEANWFEVYQGKKFTDWQMPGRDEHSIVCDPLLRDPDHGDFRLGEGSPVEELGFKPIIGAGDSP